MKLDKETFWKSEDGAVTVDWVVMTAGVVGLAIAAFTSTSDGVAGLTQAIVDLLNTFGGTTT